MFVSLLLLLLFERQTYQHIAVEPNLFNIETLRVLIKFFNTKAHFISQQLFLPLK
ncbi:hypothetical protein Hanom_Chr16g01456261 [Helianthus anomalus]